MVKPPCCDMMNMKRGLWTPEEDAKILAYVSKHGTGNWTSAPKKAGLRRCGKSCRLRWTNHLRPDLKHDNFTPEEEELIVKLHATLGSRWAIIAQQLPGRSDNDVKNYWNTKLKKKLSEMGIDPVTHKPFSKVIADYGNIGGLSKSGTRIGSLGRDLKLAFNLKPDGIPTKLEPIQDCFFNNNDHSLDLLDQLQAINLVTEASRRNNNYNYETFPSYFLNEASLSSPSSSSSSTCSTAAQEKSSSSFSWRDFLLEDEFLPDNLECSSEELTSLQPENNCAEVAGPTSYSDHSTNSSFVEAILEQENHMFSDFPDLSVETFYY